MNPQRFEEALVAIGDATAVCPGLNNKRVLATEFHVHSNDRRRLTALGAFVLGGNCVVTTCEKGAKAGDFIDFLIELRWANPKNPIILVLDNASIHRAAATWPWYSYLEIIPLFLSPYSPDLNPIETAWREGKKKYNKVPYHELVESLAGKLAEFLSEGQDSFCEGWVQKFLR